MEGTHQHSFRQSHSTTTAMLELQNEISNHMEDGKGCIIYSIDLFTAFDLLRKNAFAKQLSGTMDADPSSIGSRPGHFEFILT